jgi:GntR family transcriptional regulator / MocR family aminotransferase
MSPRRVQVRDLLISLDLDKRSSLGRQLEAQLREAIRSGRLSAEQKLPSTRMLAQDLGVSRGVVGRAYAQLAAEGYLRVTQGSNPSVGAVSSAQRSVGERRPDQEERWRFDLRPERPDLTIFPRREWARSQREALRRASFDDLDYIDYRGLPAAREEIAAYLSRARGVHVDPEHVLITAGSMNTVILVARALLRQGQRTLGFENPSHAMLHTLVRRIGLEVVGVPVDEDGIVVDALGSADMRCIVVSPAHQFPLGVALTVERRTRLLEWAERCDGIVLEDDYDAEFRYDRAPVGALQGLAPERVVYMGSASKTLAPGLRLGWAVLPARLVDAVGAELRASTLHQPSLEQLALADFVARGEFDRHLRRMRAVYRRRRDIVIRTLGEELPEVPLRGIAAGLHLIAELGSSSEEAAATEAARAAGVAVEPLAVHTLPGYSGPRGLIIGFGRTPEPTIARATRALAEVLRRVRSENGFVHSL